MNTNNDNKNNFGVGDFILKIAGEVIRPYIPAPYIPAIVKYYI